MDGGNEEGRKERGETEGERKMADRKRECECEFVCVSV